MYCSKDIVGAKGANCRRCREAVIIVKFMGIKFQDIKKLFIVSRTFGEGHII